MSEELKNSPIADFDWDAYEKGETKRDKSFEELEKTYDNSLNKFQEDEVTEGTVISINKREVVVNIGAKSDGIIPVSEFRYNPDLKVGDTVEVYVENREDKKGQLVLSHRRARQAKSWDRVNEALENNEIIKGYIKCRTKGGMIVDVFGIEAFLPGSQIDVRPIRNYDDYVDKTMEFKIVEPQALDFVVDGEVFFDVFVSRGNIGLGLVVVVVGYEIMYRILGEKALELGIELCRQGLVV